MTSPLTMKPDVPSSILKLAESDVGVKALLQQVEEQFTSATSHEQRSMQHALWRHHTMLLCGIVRIHSDEAWDTAQRSLRAEDGFPYPGPYRRLIHNPLTYAIYLVLVGEWDIEQVAGHLGISLRRFAELTRRSTPPSSQQLQRLDAALIERSWHLSDGEKKLDQVSKLADKARRELCDALQEQLDAIQSRLRRKKGRTCSKIPPVQPPPPNTPSN